MAHALGAHAGEPGRRRDDAGGGDDRGEGPERLRHGLDIWETTYLDAMASVEAVVEWMEATRLAPFLKALGKPYRRKFLDRYTAELRQAYPALPDGCLLLRSRRLFVLAQPRT